MCLDQFSQRTATGHQRRSPAGGLQPDPAAELLEDPGSGEEPVPPRTGGLGGARHQPATHLAQHGVPFRRREPVREHIQDQRRLPSTGAAANNQDQAVPLKRGQLQPHRSAGETQLPSELLDDARPVPQQFDNPALGAFEEPVRSSDVPCRLLCSRR